MPHTQQNLGRLFYKAYYKGLDWKTSNMEANEGVFQKNNQTLLSASSTIQPHDPFEGIEPNHYASFEAHTTYPGLIIGSGYQHEVNQKGELKLGFYFDHTSGLPTIPGSSIKGLLRSAFDTPELIQYFLQKVAWKTLKGDALKEQVSSLRTDIFSPEDRSMLRRDVFYDAIIIRKEGEEGILAEDFLTPHHPGEEMGQFKQPIPIAFMKIRAGVWFRFRFKLFDSKALEISAQEKLHLFENILLHMGAGSKTAVGYGSFANPNRKPVISNRWKNNVPQERNSSKGSPHKEAPKDEEPVEDQPLPDYQFADLKRAFKRGSEITGVVKDNQNGKITVEYQLNGQMLEYAISYGASGNIEIGRKVKLKVIDAGKESGKPGPRFNFGGYA